MKRSVRIVVCTIVLLVFLALAFAQETGPEEAPAEQLSYDYADYNNYQNPDFYRDPDSDPAQWDWTQVNWAVFDFERADVYDVPEFYANLPVERYSDLDYRLVPDFELYIPDHSLIDGNKFVRDFGCVGCSLSAAVIYDERPNLRYTAEGHISHLTSGDNIFVGDFDLGASFFVYPEGITVVYPQNIQEINPPSRGTFTISSIDQMMHLLGGRPFEGRLTFLNGQAYVRRGDRVTFDVLEVDAPSDFPEGMMGVAVYFDGETHPERDYVSISESVIIIESNIARMEYIVKNGLGLGLDQMIQFETRGSSHIVIEDRSEQELIPLVTVAVSTGELQMFNGDLEFSFSSGGTNMNRISYYEGNPAQIALRVTDRFGENLLGRRQISEILVFDGNNNFVVLDESYDPQATQCYHCTSTLIGTLRYAQTLARLRESNPDIVLTDYLNNPMVSSNIVSFFENLPPAIRENIDEIVLVWGRDLAGFCGNRAAACTVNSFGRNTIYLPVEFSQETFEHEAAHALTYALEEGTEQEVLEIIYSLIETYGSLENTPVEQLPSPPFSIEETFASRWAALNTELYAEQNDNELVIIGHARWQGDLDDEPRFGFFSAYGATEIREDIAEAVKTIRSDPTLVAELINPESNYYHSRMSQSLIDPFPLSGSLPDFPLEGIMTPEIAQEWAQTYRTKLDLALEYGFITEEDYQRVTRGEEQ